MFKTDQDSLLLLIYHKSFSLFADRIKELKKLNHSIVINFLELLDILIKSPSSSKVRKKSVVLLAQ